MSRRAAAAAASADMIRRGMRARRVEHDFHAAVPTIGAGALTAATAALVMHPAFERTRAGVSDGLEADVSDVMPGGDAFQSAMLRFTGGCLGGAAGARTAFELASASVYPAARVAADDAPRAADDDADVNRRVSYAPRRRVVRARRARRTDE